MPIAMLERISITLRPCRSDSRPQIGEVKAATNDVLPPRMPAQIAISLVLVTPSSGRNSGMIGVSTEFATAVTNWIATIAHSVCRQLAAEPGAVAAARSAISPTVFKFPALVRHLAISVAPRERAPCRAPSNASACVPRVDQNHAAICEAVRVPGCEFGAASRGNRRNLGVEALDRPAGATARGHDLGI